MKTSIKGLLLLAALVLAASTAQAAIDPATAKKLLAEDGAADDWFGRRVAVDGDTAVIGAHGDDDKGSNAGAAYVFVRAADGTWSQKAKLIAEDGTAGDSFGRSVAVSGDTAVIGATYDYDTGVHYGSAYVFSRDADGTWRQKAKLITENSAIAFGASVAVDSDTVVIGADGSPEPESYLGAAYVFVRAADGTWSQKAKLIAGDVVGGWFGHSVSVSGGTAVIGSYYDDDKGVHSGSAYVFGRDADGKWSQKAKLIAEDGAAEDWFGKEVSVNGDTAIIGTEGDDDKGISSGAAYVFSRDADGTWSQKAKLIAEDGAAGDLFGSRVAVSGGTAVIGVAAGDDKGISSGSAYVFVRAADGTWSQKVKLIAEDGAESDMFGISVAVSGGTAVIGAYGDDDKGSMSGSAYVFSGSTPPVTPQAAAGRPAINFLLRSK